MTLKNGDLGNGRETCLSLPLHCAVLIMGSTPPFSPSPFRAAHPRGKGQGATPVRRVQVLWEHVYRRAQVMTETLSIRIDAETKKRLDALSKRAKRSKSFLAAEAIAVYVESEEWQLRRAPSWSRGARCRQGCQS